MCRWRAWWKGLPALAVLVALAVTFARAPVEEDLTERAETLLSVIGESWAHARFEGRNALLEGEALSEDARIKVRYELARLSGVRVVEDRTTLLPERRPFTFSAIRDGSKLHLEGYVPSSYARRRIAEAAAAMAPGVVVTGEKELVRARGVPAGDFIGAVAFGIEQLAKMPAGRITLSDNAFSIEGRAPDFASYDALEVTVRSELPKDFELARFAVLPPIVSPFIWSAARERDGDVTLSGYIPLGDARRALLDLVRGAMPGAAISDRLRLADGAPPTEGWLKAAAFALAQLGRLPNGTVTLSGTTIAIEGTAPDFAAYDAMSAARRNLPEGYTLTRFAVEPPRVDPFIWGVQRSANGLRLTGFAPSEEAKRLVFDAVRGNFPGVPVSDEMRIAMGGPPGEAWVAATSFGVDQLSRLRQGSVRGNGTTLAISGEALDAAAFLTVRAALEQSPPRGFTLRSDVRPPVVSPYVFSLRKDADGLTLSGFFPSPTEHERLVEAAKSQFLGDRLNDVSAIAQGAPQGFTAAVMTAMRQLSRLDSGEVRFDDTQLKVTGTVLYPEAVASVRANLAAGLPSGFTLDVALSVAPPAPPLDAAACQSLITHLMEKGSITFSASDAAIEPSSFGLLDRLAAAAARCPEALIEISIRQPGTDAVTATARAQSLVQYLAAAGIAPDRLITGERPSLAVQSPDAAAPPAAAGVQLIVR